MEIWLWIDVVELDEAVAVLKTEIVPVVSMCVDAVHDCVLNAGEGKLGKLKREVPSHKPFTRSF